MRQRIVLLWSVISFKVVSQTKCMIHLLKFARREDRTSRHSLKYPSATISAKGFLSFGNSPPPKLQGGSFSFGRMPFLKLLTMSKPFVLFDSTSSISSGNRRASIPHYSLDLS